MTHTRGNHSDDFQDRELCDCDTPSTHDTPMPESVEEMIESFRGEADMGTYHHFDGLEDDLRQALTTAYTAGRTSMRNEILAVVPEEKKLERISNAVVIHDHDAQVCNEFRSELLANIEGVK